MSETRSNLTIGRCNGRRTYLDLAPCKTVRGEVEKWEWRER